MELKALFKCDFCKKEFSVDVNRTNISNIENPLWELTLPSYGEYAELFTTNVRVCDKCLEQLRGNMVRCGYLIKDWYGVSIKAPEVEGEGGAK